MLGGLLLGQAAGSERVRLALSHSHKFRLNVALSSLAFSSQGDRAPPKEGIVCVEKGDGLILAQSLEGEAGDVPLPNRLVPRNRVASRAPAPMRSRRALFCVAHRLSSFVE